MDDAALCMHIVDMLVSNVLHEINTSGRSVQMTSNGGLLAFMKNVSSLYARHLLRTEWDQTAEYFQTPRKASDNLIHFEYCFKRCWACLDKRSETKSNYIP